MTSIIKATPADAKLLAIIGKPAFIEAHGHSASEEVISNYVKEKFSEEAFKADLIVPENIFHIISHTDQPAGYSKIILNDAHPEISSPNITKLERLYLLKEFYGANLGAELFRFNVDLSKQQGQEGMWLYVWKENHRAIRFYEKNGFKAIGSYDFKLSETHTNPNHLMFLQY